MHIGIDANCWTNRRGYGRYTREIISAILDVDTKNDYTLFLDSDTQRQAIGLPARARQVIVPTSSAATDAASAAGHRSLTDLYAMARAVSSRRRELDLFYFPTVYTFFPLSRRLRPLVTIHDTIAERHPQLIFPHRRSRIFWNMKVAWALRQAAMVLTVSHTAKTAVMDQFSLSADRVKVVSDAVGPEFRPLDTPTETARVLAKSGLRANSPFLLYVGGISPHKNIETLIDAYCLLMEDSPEPDLTLVLVGDFQGDVFHSSYQSLQARLQSRRAASRVVFTGFVPDQDLPIWYNAAQALVMPSVDEGFGLPAVEALACGTPVVASRRGALPEVVGDAGLLFDPYSPQELAATLRRLLADDALRVSLSSKGIAQASKFSWKASAKVAIELFEHVGADQSQSA